MKKFLAMLAIVGVMVSCNNKKKEDKPADKPTSENPTKMDDSNNPPKTDGVPTFADADVQKYVSDYTAFVNSYMDAVKGKDMSKIQDLSMKATDWTSRSMDVSKKLMNNPEEAKKFSDYMTKLSTEWANAAKSMVPDMK